MSGYFLNFIVYTAAMIGVICAAIFVYKKSTEGLGQTSKSKFLGVEDTISLAPRKTLYVVRAGKERFLVAGDVDKTTLISKLDENSFNRRARQEIEELPDIVNFQDKRKDADVFRNIVSKINS